MKKGIFMMAFAAIVTTAQAQFSGKGAGTEKDPYQITNADELFDVRNNLSAYYKVMNDIDLSQWIQDDNPIQGWNPIGTESTPFSGHFDGNYKTIKGLTINRSSMDYQGLFGYVLNGYVQGVCLLNPRITGKNSVGAVVGGFAIKQLSGVSLSNNIVIGGTVSGEQYIGGVLGQGIVTTTSQVITQYVYQVHGNFSSAIVNGIQDVGGVCGLLNGAYGRYWGYNGTYSGEMMSYPSLKNNAFYGRVEGNSNVGGIVGRTTNGSYDKKYQSITHNLVCGTVFGQTSTNGIVGYAFQDITISNNVFCGDTLSASGTPMRISDIQGTNNYALSVSTVMASGRTITVDDNEYNGISMGRKTLMRQNTYVGLGFNFSQQWGIVEGETFPYHISQSAVGEVESFYGGSKAVISGSANNTGKIYVFVDGDVKEGAIIDGKWEIALGNITPGTIAKVSMQTGNNSPSIFLTAIAEKISVEPAIKAGDANGDGVIDSADVTAIINYILGKPSSSFNKENADVTGDGEILIDDAVQTVQMIMDAQ